MDESLRNRLLERVISVQYRHPEVVHIRFDQSLAEALERYLRGHYKDECQVNKFSETEGGWEDYLAESIYSGDAERIYDSWLWLKTYVMTSPVAVEEL